MLKRKLDNIKHLCKWLWTPRTPILKISRFMSMGMPNPQKESKIVQKALMKVAQLAMLNLLKSSVAQS